MTTKERVMWKTVEENNGRPGYLGSKRDQKYKEWDEKYGRGKWRLVWRWGGKDINFFQACVVYEESYLVYLKSNPNLLAELVKSASNVYDDDPSNVQSGFNYLRQETGRTHIQDIAIRRALRRLGRSFEGRTLIQIRHDQGTHPLSMKLSPGVVRFHEPQELLRPLLTGWWNPESVEDFYQSNRQLQVDV